MKARAGASAEAAASSAGQMSAGRVAVRLLLRRGLFMFGAVVILLTVVVAIFAPYIAPYDPYEVEMLDSLQPPSAEHWLGTDTIGRDTFSRLIYGSRASLAVGLATVAAALILGGILGTAAGFFGRVVNVVIMRMVDTLMAIPPLLLALTLAAVLGGGLRNIVIALSIGMIPPFARLMCAQTLTIKERDYVASLRSMGATPWRTAVGHIMPNAYPAVLVFGSMMIGQAILGEAALSFLGIGITPPASSWGQLINAGFPYVLTHPWMSIAPGVCITLLVFAFNMVGDGLRDALDPRLRGTM